MKVLNLYPKAEKPYWLKVGVKCQCNGEGKGNYFKVLAVGKNAAFLENQGWKSFKQLYR